MKNIKLGVNIDHVATIRNARGENYPDPVNAALIAQKSGANSITIHLREDRRHIRDYDLKNIKKRLQIPLNLEIAPTSEMLKIALKHKPNYVCIVPEKRSEITTEGGLDLLKHKNFIRKMINKLKKRKIRVSLFLEPSIKQIALAKTIASDCIEIHTGKFCNLYNKKKNIKNALSEIRKSSIFAHKIGLEVHAGHGLTYNSTKVLSKINFISEFNIGHFIISDSIFFGLKTVIKKFKKIIRS